jgi:hypothetical protein
VIRTIPILVVSALVARAAPVLSDAVITDVSSVACRIVWQANEAANPSAAVFTNAAGTVPTPGAELEAYPGLNEYDRILLANAGIMMVEIRGLGPGTNYYVRGTSTSQADSGTASTPLLPVTTASGIAPFTVAAPFTAVANPVLRFNCLSSDGRQSAETGLLLAMVAGARTPVSQAVTDDSTVYLEMANLVSSATGVTLAVSGGETVTLKFLQGLGKVESHDFFMPAGEQLATVEDPRLTAGPLESTIIRPSSGSDGVARVFVEFPVTPGEFYKIETSESLAPASWTRAGATVRSNDARLFWEDSGIAGTPSPPADTPRRFYRAVPLTP